MEKLNKNLMAQTDVPKHELEAKEAEKRVQQLRTFLSAEPPGIGNCHLASLVVYLTEST